VRDANDRSERRDIWPGARGGRECVSWRRRREHESSSAKGEASEQQASSSSQREGKTEGGLSRQNHIVPRSLLPPNTKQQGQYRMARSCRSIS